MEAFGSFPIHVSALLHRLERAGYPAFVVGGAVRDLALGRRPGDWDVATSARPEDVRGLFSKIAATGEKYGTVTVFYRRGRCQVTTLRREGEYENGRSPRSVSFIGDINADLARRDFTINAMAVDVRGRLTDPFGGLDDLRRGRIRCVGEPSQRFSEDALRMLRAVRFSAQLGFFIDEDTMAAIAENAWRCAALSAERVRDELEKLLLSPRPQLAEQLFSLGPMAGRAEPVSLELEGVFSGLGRNAPARWCALTAALDRAGAAQAESFFRSMRLPASLVRECAAAVEAGADFPGSVENTRLFIAAHGLPAARLAAAAASGWGNPAAVRLVRRAAAVGGIVPVSELAVNGRDMESAGLSGRQIGRALTQLSRLTTAGALPNTRAALMAHIMKTHPHLPQIPPKTP